MLGGAASTITAFAQRMVRIAAPFWAISSVGIVRFWPQNTFSTHAPARSRTWIYRLGGGRLIHWTTRALRSAHAAGRLKATVARRPRPSIRQTRPEPVRYDTVVDSPASRSSSSPTNRCVIHASIVCAPMRR
jgi:hypothetical protein